jgi:hypothetical protein
MAWLPLGEAVDRVLARLADQRNEKAGGNDAPRKVAPAEGRITGRGKQGCGAPPARAVSASRQRGSPARVTGRPGGQGE